MQRVPLLAVCLSALALAVPALASDPSSGEVSKANVKASWKGETTNGGATTITSIMNEGTVVCEAPTCDTYALNVKDSDQLTITATAGSAFTMVEVVLPDGTTIYNSGEETSNSTTVQIAKAPVGAYEVHVALNSLVTTGTYNGMAVLGPVDSKGRPAGSATPTPTPGASPTPEPQPTQPGAQLTIKTRKASARKVAKKLKVTVAASAPVTEVKAFLKRGDKMLGSGTIARIDSSAAITVKLKKKLKAGKYTLSVVGKDSGGRTVGASAPLNAGR
jgi:hypothetical protein